MKGGLVLTAKMLVYQVFFTYHWFCFTFVYPIIVLAVYYGIFNTIVLEIT